MNAIKNIIKVSLLLFAIGFSACEKYADDTPQAIKKLIRRYKGSDMYISVTEYKCDEKTTYHFEPRPMPDAAGGIFDKDGNLLCQVGGLGGLNGCEKEYVNCIEQRIIWTNKKYTKK